MPSSYHIVESNRVTDNIDIDLFTSSELVGWDKSLIHRVDT